MLREREREQRFSNENFPRRRKEVKCLTRRVHIYTYTHNPPAFPFAGWKVFSLHGLIKFGKKIEEREIVYCVGSDAYEYRRASIYLREKHSGVSLSVDRSLPHARKISQAGKKLCGKKTPREKTT